MFGVNASSERTHSQLLTRASILAAAASKKPDRQSGDCGKTCVAPHLLHCPAAQSSWSLPSSAQTRLRARLAPCCVHMKKVLVENPLGKVKNGLRNAPRLLFVKCPPTMEEFLRFEGTPQRTCSQTSRGVVSSVQPYQAGSGQVAVSDRSISDGVAFLLVFFRRVRWRHGRKWPTGLGF